MEFCAASITITMHIADTSPCKTMELKWIKATPKTLTRYNQNPFSSSPPQPSSFPVFISTKRSQINPDDLHRLYRTCDLSGHRFPASDDIAEAQKLRIALSRSAFVVSVFCKPARYAESSVRKPESLLQRVVEPLSPYNGELVGFGRAVSDMALTASIYDVMVIDNCWLSFKYGYCVIMLL